MRVPLVFERKGVARSTHANQLVSRPRCANVSQNKTTPRPTRGVEKDTMSDTADDRKHDLSVTGSVQARGFAAMLGLGARMPYGARAAQERRGG